MARHVPVDRPVAYSFPTPKSMAHGNCLPLEGRVRIAFLSFPPSPSNRSLSLSSEKLKQGTKAGGWAGEGHLLVTDLGGR